MKKLLLAILFLLPLSVSAQIQRNITTTTLTRQFLTNDTAAGARATLGIANTNVALFNTDQFTVTASDTSIKSGALLTNATFNSLSAGRVAYLNSSKVLTSHTVNSTELEAGLPAAISRVPRSGIWGDANASDRMTGYGSTGINIGTNDFSIAISASLSDWTPSATTVLFKTHTTGNSRAYLQITTAGVFQVGFVDAAAAATAYSLTPDVALVDGDTYHIVVTVDRDGSATLYINAESDRDFNSTAITVSVAASATVDIGASNTNPFGAMGTFNGVLVSHRVYNRVLTAAQVKTLLKTGIVDYSDQGASFTALNVSTLENRVDASNGYDSFTGVTATGFTADHILGTVSGAATADEIAFSKDKKYIATFYVTLSSGVGPLVFLANDKTQNTGTAISTSTRTVSGINVVEFTATSTTTGALLFRHESTDASSNYQITGLRIFRGGVLQDLDCGIGIGTHIPDRTTAYPGLLASTTGTAHTYPKINNDFIVRRTLSHSDISATAATTLLMTLPPNCGIVDIEFDRESGFDATTTLNIGISGTAAKFVSAQNVTTTGKALADSLSKVSESSSAFTPIYIQKSGATTTGTCTVRVRVVVRAL